jgi:hypothetical protein
VQRTYSSSPPERRRLPINGDVVKDGRRLLGSSTPEGPAMRCQVGFTSDPERQGTGRSAGSERWVGSDSRPDRAVSCHRIQDVNSMAGTVPEDQRHSEWDEASV